MNKKTTSQGIEIENKHTTIKTRNQLSKCLTYDIQMSYDVLTAAEQEQQVSYTTPVGR